MLSKKDIIEINRQFSNGVMINESSLDFVAKTNARSKNWLKTSAMFIRSILLDHVFEEGNKRTAAAVWMMIMDMNSICYDPELVPRIIVHILKKNITSITQIERCIKDVIRH